METRAGKRKRDIHDATATNAGQGIPGLPNHLVIMHVFRSEYFVDPADLAKLRAVSRAMRDAVAATGLEFEELDEKKTISLGCFSAVERLERGGHLSSQAYLTQAAAMGGHHEKLKVLREAGTPWTTGVCYSAA